MKSRIVIFGNGDLDKALVRELKATDCVIGVDRAAYWLLSQGVTPEVAIGDFDSTSAKEQRFIKEKIANVRVFPPKKDRTDLELAIDHAIRLNPKKVVIYGAFGGRFDHTLVAVELLEKLLKVHIEGYLKDSDNEVMLTDKRRTIKKSKRYTYLSILSYSPVATVTITGVLYPVARRVFRRGQSLGISNEVISKSASIDVSFGSVIVVRSRDRSK